MDTGTKKKLRPLNAVLVLAGMGASLALALVFMLIALFDLYSAIPLTLEAEGERLASRLSRSLVSALWNIDGEAVSRILQSEAQNPHLHAIELSHNNGDIFMVLRKNDHGGFMLDKHMVLAPDLESRGLRRFDGVLYQNHSSIGRVEIFLTDRFLVEESMRQVLRTLVVQFLVSGAVIAVLIIVLRRRVLVPITGITQVVEFFAAQDFSARVPLYPNRELTRMAEVLNGMATALQMYRQDMEGQVRTRTEQLLETTRVAQWGLLIAGLAHEINTPLGNSVMALGFLNDLTRRFEEDIGVTKPNTEEIRVYLSQVREGLDLASAGLNWTTRFMQALKVIEHGGALQESSVFDLGQFMEEIVAACRRLSLASNLSIELISPTQPVLNTYRELLALVLHHLFMLALGYSVPGTSHGKLIFSSRVEEDALVLSLSDNGRGFTDEQQMLLFSPYGLSSPKLGPHKESLAQLALGPYILRSLLESVRGSLTLQSTLGAGSVFSVRCPKHNS